MLPHFIPMRFETTEPEAFMQRSPQQEFEEEEEQQQDQ